MRCQIVFTPGLYLAVIMWDIYISNVFVLLGEVVWFFTENKGALTYLKIFV